MPIDLLVDPRGTGTIELLHPTRLRTALPFLSLHKGDGPHPEALPQHAAETLARRRGEARKVRTKRPSNHSRERAIEGRQQRRAKGTDSTTARGSQQCPPRRLARRSSACSDAKSACLLKDRASPPSRNRLRAGTPTGSACRVSAITETLRLYLAVPDHAVACPPRAVFSTAPKHAPSQLEILRSQPGPSCDPSEHLRADLVAVVEGPHEVRPAVAGEDLVGAASLAFHPPAVAEERREHAGRPRGRPVAQAAVAVSKDTITGPGGHSPCSSRSARTRRARACA